MHSPSTLNTQQSSHQGLLSVESGMNLNKKNSFFSYFFFFLLSFSILDSANLLAKTNPASVQDAVTVGTVSNTNHSSVNTVNHSVVSSVNNAVSNTNLSLLLDSPGKRIVE